MPMGEQKQESGLDNSTRQICTGYILAVQEYRFDFLSDEGQGLLLTLSRFAPVALEQLHLWHAQGAHLRVEYSGEPDLTTGIAQKMEIVERGKPY